jgi:hypothetical protein
MLIERFKYARFPGGDVFGQHVMPVIRGQAKWGIYCSELGFLQALKLGQRPYRPSIEVVFWMGEHDDCINVADPLINGSRRLSAATVGNRPQN